MWRVVIHPEAEAELGRLPPREKVAMLNAVEKLRELRPRAGRSPWRGFYRRMADVFVIAAVGPEAGVDQRGFDRAVGDAVIRSMDVEV